MSRTSSGTAALFVLALLPSPADATEPYEGAWASTAKECNDPDGPTSLTIIGLDVKIDGEARAMVEQYENHCFIDSTSATGSDTTLAVTCYEFWDDFRTKTGGRKQTIRLSVASKDALTINGRPYLRCPAKGARKKS